MGPKLAVSEPSCPKRARGQVCTFHQVVPDCLDVPGEGGWPGSLSAPPAPPPTLPAVRVSELFLCAVCVNGVCVMCV